MSVSQYRASTGSRSAMSANRIRSLMRNEKYLTA